MGTSSKSSAYATYEATKAQEWNATQADKIHWEKDAAYRNQAYRQLHHQEGKIGSFQIRLLEAAELKRSYWSPLALGPVKLLGLSKAHGAVSSFVSFSWDDEKHEVDDSDAFSDDEEERKPAAMRPTKPASFASPVIPHDDNPVWTNCVFDIPLQKGVFEDGQPIRLKLRVDEDSTAVENIVPGIPSGGDSRLLGTGTLDLTSLCLGQVIENGQPQVGVLDTWVHIRLDEEEGQPAKEMNPSTTFNDPVKKPSTEDKPNSLGKVRLLVSYEPHGLNPQKNDIVALEGFARKDPHAASCPPILPPMLPLNVKETSGPWLLVEYSLLRPSRIPGQKACLRLHRNAVFVVERTNIIDETLNLALLPADVFLSTALGRSTQDAIGPLVIASKQLLMPALLSSKLLWMAARTVGVSTASGVLAASSALWSEGSSSLTHDDDAQQRRQAQRPDGNYKFIAL